MKRKQSDANLTDDKITSQTSRKLNFQTPSPSPDLLDLWKKRSTSEKEIDTYLWEKYGSLNEDDDSYNTLKEEFTPENENVTKEFLLQEAVNELTSEKIEKNTFMEILQAYEKNDQAGLMSG